MNSSHLPYVATNGCGHYARRGDARLCDVLTCVKHKTNLASAGTLLLPNTEFHLKSPAQMARLFCSLPKSAAQNDAGHRRTLYVSASKNWLVQFPRFPHSGK